MGSPEGKCTEGLRPGSAHRECMLGFTAAVCRLRVQAHPGPASSSCPCLLSLRDGRFLKEKPCLIYCSGQTHMPSDAPCKALRPVHVCRAREREARVSLRRDCHPSVLCSGDTDNKLEIKTLERNEGTLVNYFINTDHTHSILIAKEQKTTGQLQRKYGYEYEQQQS